MDEPPLDFERVVREVLAELGRRQAEPTGVRAEAATCGSQSGELALDGRVVTLADLPERLDGVRRVIVSPRAVVTPAVRDELARRRVELIRANPQQTARERPPVLLVSMDSPLDAESLAQAIGADGYAVESRKSDCVIRASEALAEAVAGGRSLGVLLTRHAAAAACLANRRPGVRAIRGTTPEVTAADAAAVGANVLIVDTSAVGFFPTRQTVAGFLRGGARQCPDVFRKRLE